MAQGKRNERQSEICAKNTKSNTQQQKRGYWLHVAPDGTEKRLERCPVGPNAKPTLTVIVARRFERTRTYDVLVPHGKYLKWIIVRPRGQGWMRAGRGIDPGNRELCIGQRRWTGWRRKIVP